MEYYTHEVLYKTMDWLLANENGSVFPRNLHVTKNRLAFAGSQTLLASENEFNSTGSFNSKETVGAARRLLFCRFLLLNLAS